MLAKIGFHISMYGKIQSIFPYCVELTPRHIISY